MQSDRRKNGKSLKAEIVLLLVVLGQSSPAAAQSPGTFTTTGNMTTARSWHTATLLHNGKVLLAGGERSTTLVNPGPPLATTELYDLKTGAFSPTGTAHRLRETETGCLRGLNEKPPGMSSGGMATLMRWISGAIWVIEAVGMFMVTSSDRVKWLLPTRVRAQRATVRRRERAHVHEQRIGST